MKAFGFLQIIRALLQLHVADGAAAGFGQVRSGTNPPRQVAQFCVPAHDDDPHAHRLYCCNEDSWSGPAGAAAFACSMQGIGRPRIGKDNLQPDLPLLHPNAH
jgi:hypothetical protein